MSLSLFSGLLILVSVIIIFWIIIRKTPLLATIELSTMAKEQERALKKKILKSRFDRILREILQKISSLFLPLLDFLRGLSRRIHKKIREIEAVPLKVQTLDAQEISRRLILAKELLDQEQFAEAEKKFIEVISISPQNQEAYLGLGNLYLKKGELEHAREVYEHILKLEGTHLDGYLGLGKIFQELGKISQALESYNQALSLEPNNPKILDNLAEMSILLKRKDEAKKYIEKLEEVNPQNEKIKEFQEKIKKLP